MNDDFDKQLLDVEEYIPILMSDLWIALDRLGDDARVIKRFGDNIQTVGDKFADEFLRERLTKRFRSISILSEESGSSTRNDSGLEWVIDPIDGSDNFSKGASRYSTAISLVRNKVTVYGCVYDPNLRRAFTCSRRWGFRVNSRRVQRLDAPTDSKQFIAYGSGSNVLLKYLTMRAIAEMCLSVKGYRTRQTGCASLDLADVASGVYQAFVHPSLKKWDRDAGEMMVEEVGDEVLMLEIPQLRNIASVRISGNYGVCKNIEKYFKAEIGKPYICRLMDTYVGDELSEAEM